MFAKVFSQIFDSSIVENPETRFTFMDFLVLADIDGVVDMTHEAIARRTNRHIEVIRQTITELEGPDPRSRTPDASGARIFRLDDHRDWGWGIVNYEYFRKLASAAQRREKTRIRTQKWRKRKSSPLVTLCDAQLRKGDDFPSASASASALKKKSTAVNGLVDSEWIASLKDDKTYASIDVDRELGRMHNWCKVRKVTATRRRFVNWLNRVDKPMSDQPLMSPQRRQNLINFLNQRKATINRQIQDPQNPPAWAEKELAAIDKKLQNL